MRQSQGNFAPIPTEYRGIVYRSKSEAMFARYIELSDEIGREVWMAMYKPKNSIGYGSGFNYEPSGFSDDYTPDFVRWCTCQSSTSVPTIPFTSFEIIEYKPSLPTQTYVNRFAKNCVAIHERFYYLKELIYRVSYSLYWGSVFSRITGRIAVDIDSDGSANIYDCEDNWIEEYADEIRATRFDLEASTCLE